MAKTAAWLLVASIILFLQHADCIKKEETTLLEDLTGMLENWSPSRRVPSDFFCNSCRQVSSKVEKFLGKPSLNKEIETISGGVCHFIRSDLQLKCRKLLELYLREGILFFQIVFLEENLCNYTGFCPPSNSTEMILSSCPMKGRPVCDACRAAAEEIRKGLDDHNQQMNILKALFEACEKLQTHADQCKRSVFQYGPLIIGNLHKFLTGNDLCILLRMCDGTAPPPVAEFSLPPLLRRLLAAVPR